MPRIINVYHQKNKTILDNYENIDIIDIHNIINYSIDLIKFDNLQLFNYDTSNNILKVLINKLKLNGKLILSLSNIRLISRLYVDNALTDNEYLQYIKDCQSVWSIELIQYFIDTTCQEAQIISIQHNDQNHMTYITIERKSL